MNNKLGIVVVLGALAILIAVGVYSLSDKGPATETITVDPASTGKKRARFAVNELPKSVVDAVKKSIPEGAITEAKDRTEDGVYVYDIDGRAGERKFDMLITPEGQIVELNEQVLLDKLPSVVAAALKQAAPSADTSSWYIERQDKNGRSIYEVDFGKKKGKIELAVDGSIVRQKLPKAPATAPAAAG